MNGLRIFLLVVLSLLPIGLVQAQSIQKTPQIGFLYPAGGRQGSVFTMEAGGQNIRFVKSVHITGEGVSAVLSRYMGRHKRLSKPERETLRKRLRAREEQILAGTPGADSGRRFGRDSLEPSNGATGQEPNPQAVPLPEHPLLDQLDSLNLEELEYIRNVYLTTRKKKQVNVQIAERLRVTVTIDPDAAPGDRELRFLTSAGLTNPLCFQVGTLSERAEEAPYDEGANVSRYEELPVLINGQIKEGDVDRIGFQAREGQNLVIAAQARHLIPYLADAVPGWFQATLTLFDARGNEVAFADDYRFQADPVLFYPVPETGCYEVEIRDAIYRGREDFVYRLTLGEQPFVESIFPLGGHEEDRTRAAVKGWNLTKKRLPLDTEEGDETIRQTTLLQKDQLSNPVTYAVDSWPDSKENEPNNSREQAQKVRLPRIINGRVDPASDEDYFWFRGKAGEELVVEVYSRRLNSPLDSLVRLTDAAGEVLAWNDDHDYKDGFLHRDLGVITHHADSYLRLELPRNGLYYLQLADAQQRGGEAFGYRLRIGPPRPDFGLALTPSSISMRSGLTVPIYLHALRRDGFQGKIRVSLKDAPSGFRLEGGLIPAGCERIAMTLTAPVVPDGGLFSFSLEGEAQIDGEIKVQAVVPSEEKMQAFLYRHLVPSRALVVAVEKSKVKKNSIPEMIGEPPVLIPVGGLSRVRFIFRKRFKLKDVRLVLSDPPKGLTLEDVNLQAGSIEFVLKASTEAVPTGYTDNLIVAVLTEWEKSREGKARKQRLVSLGVLPAIPYQITE